MRYMKQYRRKDIFYSYLWSVLNTMVHMGFFLVIYSLLLKFVKILFKLLAYFWSRTAIGKTKVKCFDFSFSDFRTYEYSVKFSSDEKCKKYIGIFVWNEYLFDGTVFGKIVILKSIIYFNFFLCLYNKIDWIIRSTLFSESREQKLSQPQSFIVYVSSVLLQRVHSWLNKTK